MGTWSELFPNGRYIFYEGETPEAFVGAIKERFNFDPSRDERWGNYIEADDGGEGFVNYSFLCPSHLLDDSYGSGSPYPMGS
jgi:hypothetical protein